MNLENNLPLCYWDSFREILSKMHPAGSGIRWRFHFFTTWSLLVWLRVSQGQPQGVELTGGHTRLSCFHHCPGWSWVLRVPGWPNLGMADPRDLENKTEPDFPPMGSLLSTVTTAHWRCLIINLGPIPVQANPQLGSLSLLELDHPDHGHISAAIQFSILLMISTGWKKWLHRKALSTPTHRYVQGTRPPTG